MAYIYGTNVVQNGDAETNDFTGWTHSNVTIVACNFSGSYCFKLASTASMSQNLTGITGMLYGIKVSCYFYTTVSITTILKAYISVAINYDGGTKTTARIPLECIQYLKTTTLSTIDGTPVYLYCISTDVMTDISKTITSIDLTVATNSLGASLYIDKIEVCRNMGGEKTQTADGTVIYDENGLNMDYLYESVQMIWLQASEPTEAKNTDLWIDTDNYSRYDIYELTDNANDNIYGSEVITTSTANLTFILCSAVGNPGVVRMIINKSTGKLTVTGPINDLSSMVLFPNESLHIISNGTVWNMI